MIRNIFLILPLILIFNAFSIQTNAASFNCKKAIHLHEKLICNNPDLSKLDEELDLTYKKNLMHLSKKAQKIVVDGQRSWLVYWVKACNVDKNSTKVGPFNVGCSINKYKERVNTFLKNRFIYKNKYETFQIERYDAILVPKDDRFARYSLYVLSYPQLDIEDLEGPELAFAKNLNMWIFSKFNIQLEDYRYSDLEYILTMHPLSKNILGIKEVFSPYGHGTPHGDWVENAYFFNTAQMKEIYSENVLIGDEWSNVVSQYIVNSLTVGKKCLDSDITAKDFTKLIRNNVNWWFIKEGLQFNFPRYTVAPYVCGIVTAVAPWKILKPYMTDFAKMEIINIQQ